MDHSQKQLLDLVENYVAGTLDTSQQVRLMDWLHSDERARQLYLEYMDLHAALHWSLHGTSPKRFPTTTDGDYDSAVRPATIASDSWGETPASRNHSGMFRLVSPWAVAGMIAIVLLGAFAIVKRPLRSAKPLDSAAAGTPTKATVFRVESGCATLDLPNVGRIVLEGPTELELLNPMRARLKQGCIRARVTEASGNRFVVEYPDGKVTDLGTEFGINVPPAGSTNARTSLVVFDGAVDLERTAPAREAGGSSPIERLNQGEGVCFRTEGELARVMSIVTGSVATFQSATDANDGKSNRVILDVEDNLRSSDTKKFYEIVPGGFREDVLCFVDRPKHEWNGVTMEGLPRYLIGSDYVKTYCDDKSRTDLEIKVRLGRPATVYVFFRDQVPPPEWLSRDFRKTDDKVGMDLGKYPEMPRSMRWKNAKGAGNSVDQLYGVWKRTVEKAGIVTLGANRSENDRSMYGIAAVALDTERGANAARKSKELRAEAVDNK